MRHAFIIMGLCVAALGNAAQAQSTVGDALKNKPGSVGLQDTADDSSTAGSKAGGPPARTAPKTGSKARTVPGVDVVPLGDTVNRSGRDKTSAADTSGHGTTRTDSRKSANRAGTTGNSNLTH